MPDIHIGTSGWLYPPWRGVFYPKGLPHRRELEYLSSQLNSVEINGTFYSLQRPESFRRWHDETPDGFTFAVKGARFITHMKKLAGVGTPLANFFASGVLALRGKLGPLLWQLPPTLGFDATGWPRSSRSYRARPSEAAWLARRHDERLTGRAVTVTDADRPLRHALEIRHKSFLTPAFTELLRAHHIALVVADTAGRWPLIERRDGRPRLHPAARRRRAVHQRLHRRGARPVGGRIRAWADAGHDVQVHFDNDVKVHAPYDAMGLAARLGVSPPSARSAAARRSGP